MCQYSKIKLDVKLQIYKIKKKHNKINNNYNAYKFNGNIHKYVHESK